MDRGEVNNEILGRNTDQFKNESIVRDAGPHSQPTCALHMA